MVALEAATGDPVQLREAYGCFPSGVTAVCAFDNDEPVGIGASSFTSVSVEPALVSVCVQNSSSTWPRLAGILLTGEATPRFTSSEEWPHGISVKNVAGMIQSAWTVRPVTLGGVLDSLCAVELDEPTRDLQ